MTDWPFKITIKGKDYPATEEVIQRYKNYTKKVRELENDLEDLQHAICKIEEHFTELNPVDFWDGKN